MGYVFDFSIYLSKDDLLTISKDSASSFILKEIECINHTIRNAIASTISSERFADHLYQLVLGLSRFIQDHLAEMKFLAKLKLELLELLLKIKCLNRKSLNPTTQVLDALGLFLMRHIYVEIPKNKLRDLLIYETYHCLGLTPQLSGHDKLSVSKVKDIELYSLLLSKYRKPKIQPDSLEKFFQKNRSELLINLVNTQTKILHIHYDAEYLESFLMNKMILELTGQDANIHLNGLVQHEFIR